MLRAYADEHVLSAIVQALRQRGMDVVTVQERQGEGTDDADVLAEALRDGRIVLTNDTDFLIRQLVREDQKRAAQERLETLLMEGIESGPSREMTADDWEELRRRVWQRHAESGGK